MTGDSRNANHDVVASGTAEEYVTMRIAGQLFGVPVLQVQDVLGEQTIARIPLAPPEVAGSLNLRGRIVTAIDVRCRLGLPPCTDKERNDMSIVVDHRGELYSLMLDEVGEVLRLEAERFERNPPTLDALWREVSQGVYQLDDELLVVLDVPKLLSFAELAA